MVSPVLHVLPLTHPLSLLSNDCSAAACFQGPLVIAKVLEAHRAPGLFAGNGGQKILRLRRAEQFFSNRLRRAWALARSRRAGGRHHGFSAAVIVFVGPAIRRRVY